MFGSADNRTCKTSLSIKIAVVTVNSKQHRVENDRVESVDPNC